jgi:hypothetical protein
MFQTQLEKFMNKKTQKEVKPVDERKQFMAIRYQIRNGRIRLMDSCAQREDSAATTKEQAMEDAQNALTQRDRHYPCDGVMIFESVGIVRPKKIEVEVENIPLV